jgi:hypothetical protein
MNVWLLAHLITNAFSLSLVHFFSMLHTHFGLQHLIVAHVFHVVNVDIPLMTWVSTFLVLVWE